MKRLTTAASCLALSLAFAAGASAEAPVSHSKIWPATQTGAPEKIVYDAATAMEFFRNMKGEWVHEILPDPNAPKQSKAEAPKGEGYGDVHDDRSEMTVIGLGSTVMERVLKGSPAEMTIMYHMDGPEKLLLTHYCAARNVPEMAFQKSGKPGEMVFKFARVTNATPGADTYGQDVTYKIIDKDTFEQTATTHSKGKTATLHTRYKRVSTDG